MDNYKNTAQAWHGKNLDVKILFSVAGLATQIWIENEQGSLLIDTGDGTLRDIVANKLDYKKIKGLLYTHGHFDHMGGLHTILSFLRMIGRTEPLPIIAPAGCTEVFSTIDNFIRCYPDSTAYEILCRKGNSDDCFELSGMAIKPYPVVHCGSIMDGRILDQIPAFGYRISCRDEHIAISGDTGDCPALRELVQDADLAIIEASYKDSANISKDILKKVHLSEDLAIEIGKTAKEYILVHKIRR
ncbi:MAG: ribonuclease Z [candidate division Zixibacteria bacterium]|nr:ribonuclease Z [candidate division Zixibacteria bacterium]